MLDGKQGWQMLISRAILTAAFLATATQASSAGNRQVLINHLLAVHDALDRMCRGWSGDDAHTTEHAMPETLRLTRCETSEFA
jgi:hypothetical protein